MKHFYLSAALMTVPLFATAETIGSVRPPVKLVLDAQPKAELHSDNRAQIALVPSLSNQPPSTVAKSPEPTNGFVTDLRPPARSSNIPRTRWQHMQGNELWTRAALSALKGHGKPLADMVPRDIADWCPAYKTAPDAQRRAFWVGFLSALAKHESTYKPWAVGGGGRWYGLLQILPRTARGYKCNVGTGEALKNGAANLSCAVRIMAHTVPRDGVIHGYRSKRGQGVTADWGPMHSAAKRRDMAGWLRRQNYCKVVNATRPKARP